jgi:hypothetical protein
MTKTPHFPQVQIIRSAVHAVVQASPKMIKILCLFNRQKESHT